MRPGAALFAGTFVGALLGYAFFVVLGRSLSPDDLGAVGSLINVSTILGVPGLGIQLVTARGVAARPGAGGGAGPHLPLARHGARALGAALLVGLALTAVLALGSPLLAWLLHLPVPAVLALALSAVPMTVSMAGFGMLQGSELFAGLGLASLMVGVTKLSAALLASALGLGVLGVMVAYSLGWLVTALLTLALVARGTGASVLPSPGAPVARAVARAAREGLVGALPTAGLLVLSSLDLIVARHHLPAAASGAYTIGALFEKVAFWGPQFLATLSYPGSPGRPSGRRPCARRCCSPQRWGSPGSSRRPRWAARWCAWSPARATRAWGRRPGCSPPSVRRSRSCRSSSTRTSRWAARASGSPSGAPPPSPWWVSR
ncbi:lipopolysaccharide biosynthesis protein [Arsenicicoccus piscis]|uniref:Polysaccharide biosynthesis protein C-terminal domain-containing protein n=1 Tax=Arsenicicoccus piscis TaxID=673954 RepID=A0ABQ6HV28_9MICO|nr:hypothetical protein [Arsenicicoccus piscis]GMA21967.1 hypothetical protein GCM10025862_39880 [Arsenicicoccus piscis]